jgi:hypothetical protein
MRWPLLRCRLPVAAVTTADQTMRPIFQDQWQVTRSALMKLCPTHPPRSCFRRWQAFRNRRLQCTTDVEGSATTTTVTVESTTAMACEDAVMLRENAFLRVIGDTRTFERDGGTPVAGFRGETLATFEPLQ